MGLLLSELGGYIKGFDYRIRDKFQRPMTGLAIYADWKRKVSREKIVSVINFIKYFVPFTNSENLIKFDQDLNHLIKADQPMRIEEAILDEVKKQGIAQGIEKGIAQGIEEGIAQGIEQGIELGEVKQKEELLKHAVPELAQLGLDAERIAAILDLELEAVRRVMGEDKEDLVA